MAKKQQEPIRFDDNPVHTGVTKDTASTPGYFRLLLPGAMARYVLRSLVESSPHIISDLHRLGLKKVPLGRSDHLFTDVEALTGRVAQAFVDIDKNDSSAQDQAVQAALDSDLGKNLQRNLRNEGIKTDELGEILQKSAERTTYESKNDFYGRRFKDFGGEIEKTVTGNAVSRLYDYGLGAGSLLMTGYYANRVASDIKKVFAETVAYEFDKDPKNVTYRDLWHSKNLLVKEVRENFIEKNLGRVGTDLIFFAGALGHIPGLGFLKKYRCFGDIGVGAKGLQLVGEILNKNTTIFVDLVQLIDNKMNPLKGLGAPITVADTFDLYQKYTQAHDPKATFRDALSGQNHDGRDWGKAQAIFRRVSELMNLTYKYKHVGHQPSDNEKEQANFPLPKFLYLLGNGLIDTYKPEETLAYVEVANSYGIPAVRQLQRALERGIPVQQALVNYPEELRQSIRDIQKGGERNEETKANAPAERTVAPDTKIHSASDIMAMHSFSPHAQLGA